MAGRHSLICHYSHQASGTATLALCVRARAVSLIGILVAGWGKAESPWRPETKEKSRGDRQLRNERRWDERKGMEVESRAEGNQKQERGLKTDDTVL